jgi:hypothetical protein
MEILITPTICGEQRLLVLALAVRSGRSTSLASAQRGRRGCLVGE